MKKHKFPLLPVLSVAWLAIMMSAPATAAKIGPDKPDLGSDKQTERGGRDDERGGREDRSADRGPDVGGKAKKKVVKKAGVAAATGVAVKKATSAVGKDDKDSKVDVINKK